MKGIVCLILVLCISSGSSAGIVRPTVWIDADPACGTGRTADVDDCWAIAFALTSRQFTVPGLSIVFGNAERAVTYQTAEMLLEVLRQKAPDRLLPNLYGGAHKAISTKSASSLAVQAMARTLSVQKMTILALGPLTNLAELIRRHPERASNIEKIIVVGGHKPGQSFRIGTTPFLHFHDMNVREDPDAAEIVLRSGIPVHLVPFEASFPVRLNKEALQKLAQADPLYRWLADHSAPWLSFWEETLGAEGFAPFDTLAVLYTIRPDLFSCSILSARLVRRRGFFTRRDTLEVTGSTGGVPVTYCVDVAPEVKERLADFLLQPIKAARAAEPASFSAR